MKMKSIAALSLALAASTGLVSVQASAAGLAYETANTPAREYGAKSVTVTKNGLTFTAANRVIGQTPTSDILPPSNTIGGGDPLYKPSANKSGVVALIMTYDTGAAFICSGSVLAGGMSIATAAHCVSDGGRNPAAGLVSTTAYFFDGDPDTRTVRANAYTIDVSRYIIHPDYTGEVIDQNDIAILRLESAAPQRYERYDLFTSDIAGANFNVAGYGTRSTSGGDQGNTAPFGARTGFLREGDNKYDYAWGDERFQGFFTDVIGGENFFGTADIEFSYVSDFDNGLAAQDQSRRIANALGLGPLGDIFFTDTGRGAREVGIAGGDSGGPGFIAGRLASINSYGLTFGANFGDFGGGLNAGWGEFSGYVPVFIHTDFINAAMAVPEPSSWALLIAGFGLTGAAMRRQRKAAATA